MYKKFNYCYITKIILELWQRELCQFYIELLNWRSTMINCGFSVPVINPKQEGNRLEQWEEAHSYWTVVYSIWEEHAADVGISSKPEDIPQTSK